MTPLETQHCYPALRARDARFDGRFFVGVKTTGIFCRPICPARTPAQAHCAFFRTAAGASAAGFRPCLRCRPEAAPNTATWKGTASSVGRALRLIESGALDGAGTVQDLAARVGLGARQLRRLFQTHVGATPIAVAQARRVLLAKQLLHDTRLPMVDVALAAGFGSVRRFNEVFKTLFDRPPATLRRDPDRFEQPSHLTLRVSYRPPFDWETLRRFFAVRAIDGVESVDADAYHRVVHHDGHLVSVSVRPAAQHAALEVTVQSATLTSLSALIAGVRRVFDLGADPTAVTEHFRSDALLGPLVERRPGLRVPGGWTGFEIALRAVLGQQISVEAARKLAGQLVQICGTPAQLGRTDLTHAFPTPAQVATADLSPLRMPGARKATLVRLAEAAMSTPDLFFADGSVEETTARLEALRGIGPWTAHYIALRGMGEPDAFPASDVGILRAMTPTGASRPSAKEATARAEPWRPWRSYAAQHLWVADSDNTRES